MKLNFIYLTLFAVLSGCAFTDTKPEQYICFSDGGEIIDCQDQELIPASPNNSAQPEPMPSSHIVTSNVNFILLSEYVEQMAMDLRTKYSAPDDQAVSVASFVPLDTSLQNATVLGNQISEYFINELKSVNIPVSDHKVMGTIKISANGDFAMSRQIYELKRNINIGYVLTGTLIENSKGVIVNARIVSLSNNRVVASSSKLIPKVIWKP